ncbi:hypothetical protein, partial [Stenotrophomonas maltophilia]|uniref:hypothetical protein n=1 Tax=Stenotrophomonas maltophilia TaxID=40324 RepID=UPI001954EFF5
GLRRGRRKYVPVGSIAPSMALTPLRSPPARPLTVSVCVRHGKEKRKSKSEAGRFARIHAWRGCVSTKVDTYQKR